MSSKYAVLAALPFVGLSLALPLHAQNAPVATAEPAMQLPPDQAAFKTANAMADRQARVAALEQFLHDFPKSKRAGRAREIVLAILVNEQPQDLPHIHRAAEARVNSADKDSRADEENSVAYALAEAPPNGIDLQAAERWARDSVKQLSLPKTAERMRAAYAKYKEPAPSDQEILSSFNNHKAGLSQTLADVYLREGKLAEAAATLDQAQALNLDEGDIHELRGELEHMQHRDREALDELELAEVRGGMTQRAQVLLSDLYAAQHGGDRTGLEAEIDARYAALYQAAAPVAHTPSTTGHTVLLQLFTGSACGPCAAADLAVDGVLRNYPRNEVVALAFDQHIPQPDPLANAATIARGSYDAVQFTPSVRIDGKEGPLTGGRRNDAAKSYETLSKALDKQLGVPTGSMLRLAVSLTREHTVQAKAEFQVTDAAVLQKQLASSTEAAAAKPAPQDANLVLNFALVQREVRFSGENGIRFHAMVVRALAKPTAEGFPVPRSGSASASFAFDPAAVSAANSKYLADFVLHNDRFGAPHFLSTDTAMPLEELAVAAWVEDLSSHQVVAAAFTPLQTETVERAAR